MTEWVSYLSLRGVEPGNLMDMTDPPLIRELLLELVTEQQDYFDSKNWDIAITQGLQHYSRITGDPKVQLEVEHLEQDGNIIGACILLRDRAECVIAQEFVWF